MALTMDGNAESSRDMEYEMNNSSGETIGTGQFRWERECGNVTSPFVILNVTGFGVSCMERETRTIAVGREAPVLGK